MDTDMDLESLLPTESAVLDSSVVAEALFGLEEAATDEPECTITVEFYIHHVQCELEASFSKFKPLCPLGSLAPGGRRSWYLLCLKALQRHASNKSSFSLDSASRYLSTENLLGVEATDVVYDRLARHFVFALIGASTYLFRPIFAESMDLPVYRIQDLYPKTSHRYASVLANKIMVTDTRRPVSTLLKGFGELGPTMDPMHRTSSTQIIRLYPETFNAHLIISVLKVNIKWTDILCAHLDYDDRTNTLFLFKFPAFCLLNSILHTPQGTKTLWQSCTKTHRDDGDLIPRDLMSEIILSIFLLFGQHARSRHIFHPKDAFPGLAQPLHDPLLKDLCKGLWPLKDSLPEPKSVYYLPNDFPMLSAKLDYLYNRLSQAEPTTLRQLWRDTRNTNQWYTFWAVIFYGTLGLVLAVVQTGLGAAQVYLAGAAGSGSGQDNSTNF
ncbi:hypothetical protein QBC40DRAFT_253763 [Triangularia verruculosa]|uniref:Uncharacterized protein n=1 Tax=Triangularia verruculosa TaxID=2587418 RepID=A0AAN6XHK2_9PEZI|nr:hypothetical protein QBC40DRAFT_253763 [Triangularia verruculosa]